MNTQKRIEDLCLTIDDLFCSGNTIADAEVRKRLMEFINRWGRRIVEYEERHIERCMSAGCEKPAMEGSVLCQTHYEKLPKNMRGG